MCTTISDEAITNGMQQLAKLVLLSSETDYKYNVHEVLFALLV